MGKIMVRLATTLLIIGGLNWLLVGLFQYDLVAAIFGGQSAILSRVIYTLVGLAAVYEILIFPRFRKIENRAVSSIDRIGKAA
jgi:uncharacterized protein